MQGRAGFHLGEVNGNEFRQIARQAGHFDVGGSTRDDALVDLNGRAEFFAREVQRHTHRHDFIRRNALEVDVHDLLLIRVHLEVTQNNEFFLAVEFHRQNGSVELFLAQRKEDRVVFKLDRGGGVLAAVNDARELVRAAQTAARTRTLRCARGGDDFHEMTPNRVFLKKNRNDNSTIATNCGADGISIPRRVNSRKLRARCAKGFHR